MWQIVFFQLISFTSCMTGPLGPDAEYRAGINVSWKFDVDEDEDLDLYDYAAFQNYGWYSI